MDHAPPKCVFCKPYPPNLLTVPCCESCNHRFSTDEDEEFRLIVTMRGGRNAQAAAMMLGKILPGAASNEKAREAFRERLTLTTQDIGGGFLVPRMILRTEVTRVQQQFIRLGLAILWKKARRRVPLDVPFETGQVLFSDWDELPEWSPWTRVGEVFAYRLVHYYPEHPTLPAFIQLRFFENWEWRVAARFDLAGRVERPDGQLRTLLDRPEEVWPKQQYALDPGVPGCFQDW